MSTLLRSIPYFFTLCVSLYVVSFLGSDLNLTSIRRSQAFASTLLSSLPFLHGSSSPDLKTNHLPDTFSYSYANRTEQANASTSDVPVAHRTLGIASRIYVVSLPRRVDRRARLDALFNFMKIEKTWWDATSSQSFLVGVIMERVRWERAMHAIRVQWGHEHYPTKAAPQEEDLHAASLRYTTKAFKDAVELNEEDRVFWNDDAEANPDVYPPLLGKLQSGTSLPSLDLEDTSRRNTSKVLRMPLDGSELWTLDPLLDNRSTRLTNPIPPPPYPDLRLPIPCAPLHLAFDVPSTDALYTDEAAALMLYEGEGSVGGEGDKPVKATDSRLRSSFSREPCHELCDLEVEDMDEDGITQNLERRHPLAPPSPYPHHLTLSRGMVACWDSHLRLLRHIAGSPDESVIVLEDDVDLEFDLGHILNRLGGALPENWDIVFLGRSFFGPSNSPLFLSRTAPLILRISITSLIWIALQVTVGPRTKTFSLLYRFQTFLII